MGNRWENRMYDGNAEINHITQALVKCIKYSVGSQITLPKTHML
jgi:hypothetical protein